MARNDIITYDDIKRKHGGIQKGINYGKGNKETVILMSGRKDAPYVDKEVENYFRKYIKEK